MLRVLHLPVNLGSQASVTVCALRDIGVDARGLVRSSTVYQDARGLEAHKVGSLKEHPVRARLQRLTWWWAVARALRWADVVHWHSRSRALPGSLDLKYLARVHKPRVVEFWGTDIRIPRIASADNPYYAAIYDRDPAKTARWARMAEKALTRFARHGLECLIPTAEMMPYAREAPFPHIHATLARVMTDEFDPSYPDPHTPRPVVVHTPSSKGKKGTAAVEVAVERLRPTHDFAFHLVHGMPRAEALEIVRGCDVMVDELVSGSYGVATLEAMALGKPVICYLKPSLLSKYPADCPIVNATQENIADVLGGLLRDGPRRHQVGRASRAYVEKHHDAHKIARDLVRIYEELIEKSKRR